MSLLVRAVLVMGWRSLVSLFAASGLTISAVRWGAAVLRGDTSSVSIAIAATVLGGALYFWHHVLTELLPRLILEIRLNRAWRESNWTNVKTELERAFSRGWVSDEWRASLALANQRLDNREDAIDLYDQIQSPLRTEELEFTRLFNHSVCLLDLGRRPEARALFERVPFSEWPEAMRSHVEEHRKRLGSGEP